MRKTISVKICKLISTKEEYFVYLRNLCALIFEGYPKDPLLSNFAY